MKFRRKEIVTDTPVSDLITRLYTASGKPVAQFPNELIDHLRRMVTRIHYKDKLPQAISLTSAIRQEGVSYISWALGTTMAADLQKKVCVVELNWRYPAVQIQFGEDTGLAAVLSEKIELDEAIVSTNIENLSILPAGTLPPEKSVIWARSNELQQIINHLGERFDHLLLDVPAVRTTSDAIPLASLGDACGLVVSQGVTSITDVRLALDDIAHLPMLGVIMNFVAFDTPSFITKFIPQA
jgi:Mrp family chromosome partitioning ATPase